MNNLLISGLTYGDKLYISKLPDIDENQCSITITMDWHIAYALRKFAAPFLAQFCKGIDVRTRQEKIAQIEKIGKIAEKRKRTHERNVRKIRRYKAVYELGITYKQWKALDICEARETYYKTRRRAILWLKNKKMNDIDIANHFGISLDALSKVVKSTHRGNSLVLTNKQIASLSRKDKLAYYKNEPISQL